MDHGDKMNIQIPNITDIPTGNISINTIATECVYPVYNNFIIINLLFLFILELQLNKRVREKMDLKEDDFVHRRVIFFLSDDFLIGSLFILNFYLFMYTFIHVPYLVPLLS